VSAATVKQPSVVLLHGLGATADLNWSTTIPALSAAFRVVAPDLRGHGRSAAEQRRVTLEDAADDVAALADVMALGPFIVVGYSMGGAIAQLLCRRHPDQVRGLVLCATSRSFCESSRERALVSALPSVRLASRAIPGGIARAATQRIVARLFRDCWDPALEEHIQTFDPDQVVHAARALGDYSSHDWDRNTRSTERRARASTRPTRPTTPAIRTCTRIGECRRLPSRRRPFRAPEKAPSVRLDLDQRRTRRSPAGDALFGDSWGTGGVQTQR
jgi:pimeloyl-ACP methyl ester carboxylesterase